MANVTVKGTFKDLCAYLPSGDEVSRAIDAAYRCLTPAERLADNLGLYAFEGISTTKQEIDDDPGARPLLVVGVSKGTACWIHLHNADADSVTAGVDVDLLLPLGSTTNEVSWLLIGGASYRRMWVTGLTISASTATETSSAPSNTPNVYVLYTGS